MENFITVPLRIEDMDKALIKETSVVLNIQPKEDFRLVKAVIPEGTFSGNINIKQWLASKMLSEPDDEQWILLMHKLIPLSQTPGAVNSPPNDDNDNYDNDNDDNDNDSDFTDEKNEKYTNLQLYGKFTMSKESYEDGELKEDFDLVENFLTIYVRSNQTVSKTYGSFKLEEADNESIDFFKWIKKLIYMKDSLTNTVKYSQKRIHSLEFERDEYKKSTEELKANNKRVLDDLMNNFAFILNSKKRKIVELTAGDGGDPLSGLNRKFEADNRSKLDNITIDEKVLDKLPNKLDAKFSGGIKRANKRATRESSKRRQKSAMYEEEQTESGASGEEPTEYRSEEITRNGSNTTSLTDRQIVDVVMGQAVVKHEEDSDATELSGSESDSGRSADSPGSTQRDEETEEGNKDVGKGEVGDSLTDYSE
ncbi:hypothetical protein CANTEDRAFT_94872 [Yamadazyma tenuis ATCC 10573]|uniref:Uncharacterized protein n=1 Tax=Candida tenuis (strain ATCC 10573 / BCRC 21748 / CBS 615 / JCM 9827 / NBRC 10315 / NRRL Y-1498 / VKM Y-70) TaxID=590646 RepID=G3BA14_CANTC|nr:uncharacterized protein CANTEDRAFT_94872 [Yamadazyma tenuis ATCC 10573]EGV61986.1 hypothetical protein CANTEDRAFT_94872 [Yamadazyma tenuis ATCC 10573]